MITIANADDWKDALVERLREEGVSRYSFTQAVAARKLCSLHTAQCLLAAHDTVTGQREPSLALGLEMARAAGFDVVLVPRRAPQSVTPRRKRPQAAPAPAAV
jgi:hypothetical protein